MCSSDLASKATLSKRLSAREYWAIRREGTLPATPQEEAVLHRTLRLGKIVIGVACALPLLIALVAYMSMSGSYYLDTNRGEDGGETIVVRAGAANSWFSWLPSSPSFDSVVADTGLSSRMVSEKFWRRADNNSVSGSLDGNEYAAQATKALQPQLAHTIAYASNGEAAALDALETSIGNEEEFAQVLNLLGPIAHGSAEEEQLVATALAHASQVVQTQGLLVAAAAAQRHPGTYSAILGEGLASADARRRRLTIAAVRTLEPERAEALFQSALASEPGPAARRELLALQSTKAGASTTPKAAPTVTLLDTNISKKARENARALLVRSFHRSPAATAQDASRLIANAAAVADDRILAMSLALSFAPEESYSELASAVQAALGSKDINVRAAALPLSAHLAPKDAAGGLARLLSKDDLGPAMHVALALAWGEVARGDTSNRTTAKTALEQLLESDRNDVKAAAARSYGYLGRSAQSTLAKLVKKAPADVSEGAAFGLANTVEMGASSRSAIVGIRAMWKREGQPRRTAARVYAHMARTKASSVYSRLIEAARSTDDDGLHAIGVEGLCNALRIGHPKAGRDLARVAGDASVAVRRIAIHCVVDNPKRAAAAARVAVALAGDSSDEIRAESARILAALAGAGQGQDLVEPALSKMVGDTNRRVRMLAISGLSQLGREAPKAAVAALPMAFEGADREEKLLILDVATEIDAVDIVMLGIADASPVVRIRALDAAITTATEVNSALSAALTDADASVRRAALQRLSEAKHGLPLDDVDTFLALATRDTDPAIAASAMMASARLGEPNAVVARLGVGLANRSEAVRAKAATASLGLVAQDPAAARELLEPLLRDESHDVRVAILEPLARALAATMDAPAIAKLMIQSEDRANRRLVAAAALWLLSANKVASEATMSKLQSMAKNAPPLAKHLAALVLGLRARSADGLAFLSFLVP